MKTTRMLAAVVLATTMGMAPAIAITVSPPPAREYVAQTWVGFSIDDAYSLRLDLQKNGTGAGSVLSGSELQLFKVTSWIQKGDDLEITIVFLGNNKTRGRLLGRFKSYLLSWNSDMMPHPERVYEGKLPGPLELTMQGSGTRFGVWPEKELSDRLRQLKPPVKQ